MRRFVLGLTGMGMCLTLAGCGGGVVGGMLGYGTDMHRPVGDSPTMQRALGLSPTVTPMRTAPGDVWPNAMPAVPTLSDLQKSAIGKQLRAPPMPAPQVPAATTAPASAPAGKGSATTSHGATSQGGIPKGAVLIPNGNGTSTVIMPDGSVKTVPSPKP